MNEYMRSIVESTEAIAKQRDDARAEAERLKVENEALRASPDLHLSWLCKAMAAMGHGADQARWPKGMYVIEALILDRDRQQKRAEAIENAARGLLADLDNPEGSLTWSCRECPRVSTCQVDGSCYCDEHSPGGGWDTTYAPTIRTLRALLEGKPGDTKTEVERLKAERDHQQQRADALEDAARALVADLDKEARQCGKCYALATVAQGLPRGGFVFHCDKHATPLSAGWQDDPREDYPTNVVAPLRALRALLEGKS